jgi:monovalent cation/hydrogen antiporter
MIGSSPRLSSTPSSVTVTCLTAHRHARTNSTPPPPLARLEEFAAQEWTRDDTVERMRGLYQFRRRRLKARGGYLDDDGDQDRSLAYQRLVRELLEAQRREIVLLRNQGQISNEVMHRIERELDLEDARLKV